MKKKTFTAGLAACALLLTCSVPGIYAYMTDMGGVMDNPFTIALDCTTTVVEKYPKPDDDPNSPVPDGNIVSYEKLVQFANTGFIDCYVRAKLDFSEDDIEAKSKFSWDGTNFYSVAEYKNHLPEGWTYNSTDGFYYYTPVLKAENWDVIRDGLVYDKTIGEWFYDPDDTNIRKDPVITVPLIRYVKTEFTEPADMRGYYLHVYNESVPFYFGNDYKQSWDNYLEMLE